MAMAFMGGGEVLPEGVSPGEALPIYKGGKAQGILDTGNELIPLESGYKGPSARMPEDAPGMRADMPNRSHIEAHAATIMREQGLNEATFYINKEPCTPLMGCNENLKHMLPEDATLHVKIKQSDGGWVSRDYTGVSDSTWEQVWSTISTLWKR